MARILAQCVGRRKDLVLRGLAQGPGREVGSYRWSLLGKLSIEPVSEALQDVFPPVTMTLP